MTAAHSVSPPQTVPLVVSPILPFTHPSAPTVLSLPQETVLLQLVSFNSNMFCRIHSALCPCTLPKWHSLHYKSHPTAYGIFLQALHFIINPFTVRQAHHPLLTAVAPGVHRPVLPTHLILTDPDRIQNITV